MRTVYQVCCGIDVHKKNLVACLIAVNEQGQAQRTIRECATVTAALLELADWLAQAGCRHVAMESTGVYWKPVYNLLEGQCDILVVNAQHLKRVPGRKTDVRDAEWIAELLQHGLLQGSFIPGAEQRSWRDLTRYRRTLVEDRTRILNRIQQVLEDANLKLGDVVSSMKGLSARRILDALIDGQTNPALLANLAMGRLRHKRAELEQALKGNLKAHHRFMLAEYLAHVDYLDEAVEHVNQQLDRLLKDLEAELALLDTIPGISQRTAQVILAELGSDLTRFPNAKHLASWAGLCPGNNESAGQRQSARTRHGNTALRQALIEAAHAATRRRDTYFHVQFRRLAARRGVNRALVAVAHSLLTVIYHVLTKRQPYQELGSNYFDERDRTVLTRKLLKRLATLGVQVQLVS